MKKILLFLIIFSTGFFAKAQCPIEVTISNAGWGDNVTWQLQDAADTAVLSGGPYTAAAGYNDVQSIALTNAPYRLIVTVATNTFCDNLPDYSVTVGGVQDVMGSMLVGAGCGGADTFAITTPCPTCSQPTGLTAVGTAVDSATVSFTPFASGDSTIIEYGPAGFTVGTGTVVATTSSPVVLSGLMASTAYDVYAFTSCISTSGDSSAAASASFSTLCAAVNVFPSMEDFDALTPNNAGVFSCITSDNIDNCWSNDAANTNMWTARSSATGSSNTGPSADHTGGGNYVFLETSSCFNNTSYLYSAEYDVTSLASPRLTFWYHMWGAAMGTLSVEVSTDNGGTWSPSVWSLSGDQTNAWFQATVDLPSYAGTSSLMLRFTGVSGADFTSDMAIDDVQMIEGPSCLEPVSFVSLNVNSTTVDLAWTSNGSGTIYEVAYDTAGFTLGAMATVTGITDTFYNVTGLNTETMYEAYVRTNCGPADSSVWVGPIAFTTLPACPVAINLSDSLVSQTEVQLSWDVLSSATEWQIEYGFAGFAQGSLDGTYAMSSTNPFSISGLQADTTYDFYLRDVCAAGDTSLWTGPLSVYTGYCLVSTTNTGDYLSAISTTGGSMNATYTASTQPAGSYADETAQIIETFPNGSFDFSTTYVGGSNGVNIWVDWNNDFDFDDAGELVFSQADASATKTGSLTIPLATPLGSYRVRVRGQFGTTANPPACGNVAWGSTVDFTLNVVMAPACATPTALTTEALSVDTGLVTFSPFATGDSTIVEFGTAGFAPGTGTVISTVNDTVYLTGLMAETTYDVYVLTNCASTSGDSSSAAISSFTTPCGVTSVFPDVEDFDALTPNNAGIFACITTDNITNCWSNDAANTNMWTARSSATGSGNTGPSADHTGGGNYVFLESSSCSNVTSFLYSTEYNVSSLSNPRLRFWYHMWGATMGTMTVEVSTDQGATWSPSVWTQSGDQGNNWIEAEVDLVAYANAPSLMLRFTGVTGTSFTSDMGIDDVQIDQLPTCFEPLAFTSANVSSDTIDLAWTSNMGSAPYEIVYDTAGFTPGATATVSGITDTFYTVTGLMPETDYDVYVRANCGPADSSVWTGPINFTTLATCLEPLALGADPIYADSANLFWTANGVATEWEIEIDTAGFTASGTPNVLGIMDTFYLATGLSPETSYEYYVRSRCSVTDSSVWSGPFAFTTKCAAVVPFYTTGFATTQPNCWELATDGDPSSGPTGFGSSNDWVTRTTFNPAGSAAVNLFTTGASDWLLSPIFDLSGGIYQVEVEVAITNFNSAAADAAGMTGTDDEVQLVYSVDGGVTWINITTWNASNQPDENGSIESFLLPSLGFGVQFGIWASEGLVNDVPDYDFHVNSFTVELAPMDDVGVTAITAPSAGCGSEFTPIVVEVENFGTANQTFIPVVVELTGAVTGTYTAVVNSLPSGATATVTLDSVDTEVGGLVTFTAFTVFPIDEDFTNDTSSINVEFGTIPVAPIFMGETICEGESFTRSSSTNVKVYEAGSSVVLANDTTFTLSPISTTTYEYEAIGSLTENVGATIAPTTGFITATPDWGLRFNSATGFILNSVVLYPSGTGTVDVSILDDASETVLQTISGIAISDGGTAFSPVTVPLGFVIPGSAADYRISISANSGLASLGRGSGLGGFPYSTSGGEVNILGGSTGGSNGTSTSYYWFYDWNVSIEGCPSARESFTIVVSPSTTDTIVVAACDSAMVHGNFETVSGFYSDTLMSANNCDSIVVVDLTINSSSTGAMTASFCTGDSVALPDGSFASAAGMLNVTITNAAGCDSVIAVTVTELMPSSSAMTAGFCTGDSVALPDGSFASAAGTVMVTIMNAAGCDSVITVTVSELMPSSSTQSASFCAGSNYTLPNGMVVSAAGTYTSTIANAAGCDSVITTNLTELPSYSISQNIQLCAGDSVVVGSNVYSATGTYTDVFTIAGGCDSTVTTNLVVFTALNVTLGGVSTVCENAGSINLALNPVGGTLSGPGVTGTSFDPAVAGVGTHVLTYAFADANGCSASASLSVDVVTCTGIEDIEGIETISIFPNPYVDAVNLLFEDAQSSELNVTLYDVLGKVVLTQSIKTTVGVNNVTINVPAEIAAGVTLLQLERNGAIYNTTLIKE